MSFSRGHQLEQDNQILRAQRAIALSSGLRTKITGEARVSFGQSAALTAGTREQVWNVGGIEVLPTGNTIDTISSTNVGDVGGVVIIDGHTIVGGDFIRVIQQVGILNGQTKSLLTTPLARVDRMLPITALLGDVWIYEDTAIVAGVPTDKTKAHIETTVAHQGSHKCVLTASANEYLILTGITLGMERSALAAAADFEIEFRAPGITPSIVSQFTSHTYGGTSTHNLDPPSFLPPNGELRILTTASSNGVIVDTTLRAVVAKII